MRLFPKVQGSQSGGAAALGSFTKLPVDPERLERSLAPRAGSKQAQVIDLFRAVWWRGAGRAVRPYRRRLPAYRSNMSGAFCGAQKIDLAGRKTWCVSHDPEFAAKAAEIVGLSGFLITISIAVIGWLIWPPLAALWCIQKDNRRRPPFSKPQGLVMV